MEFNFTAGLSEGTEVLVSVVMFEDKTKWSKDNQDYVLFWGFDEAELCV